MRRNILLASLVCLSTFGSAAYAQPATPATATPAAAPAAAAPAAAAPVAAPAVVHPAHEGPTVSIPASAIKFGPTGVKTSAGELMAGAAYGNLGTGKHGTFIKMPAGFVSIPHTHTEDYFGVVLEGTAVNSPTGVKDIALPKGSYWFQKGEEEHVTKCISKTPCLFFLVQPGKFDYVPTAAAQK